MLQCSRLDQAVETPDGSLVALGSTRDCGDFPYPASPDRWQVLVGITADGSIRSAFGNGGAVLDPLVENERIEKLAATGSGGFLVLTDRRIRSYSADGVLDRSFGTEGHVLPVSLTGMNATPSDLVSTGDGHFLVVGSHSSQIRIARYDQAGQLDQSFGTKGVTDTGLPGYGASLTLDSDGRILVATPESVMRFQSDGTVDSSFAGGTGSASIYGENVFAVSVSETGGITVLVGYFDGWYESSGNAFYFDEDGLPPGDDAVKSLGFNVKFAISYPGGIATSYLPGRRGDPRIWFGTSEMEKPKRYAFTPGFAALNGIAPLRDGSLLAIGSSGDSDCGFYCGDGSRMVLAKLDPSSGNPVTDFGAEGTRLLPANTCKFGAAGSIGDWKRCRVKPPRVTGKARITRPYSRRPAVRIKASLGVPPSRLWGTSQRLVVRLPAGFTLKKKLERLVKISTSPTVDTNVVLEKRRITVTVRPGYNGWAGPYDGEVETDDRYFFRIKLERGALKPWTGRSRKKPGKVILRGRFAPSVGGMEGDSSQVWYSSNSSATAVRLRR